MLTQQTNNVFQNYQEIAKQLRKQCSTLQASSNDSGKEYTFPTFKIYISSDSVSMANLEYNISFTITDGSPTDKEYLIAILFKGNVFLHAAYTHDKHIIKSQRQEILNPDIDILTFIEQELALATPQNTNAYSSYVATLKQAFDTFTDIFNFAKSKNPNQYIQDIEKRQQAYQESAQRQKAYRDIYNILQFALSKIGSIKLSDLLDAQQLKPNKETPPNSLTNIDDVTK